MSRTSTVGLLMVVALLAVGVGATAGVPAAADCCDAPPVGVAGTAVISFTGLGDQPQGGHRNEIDVLSWSWGMSNAAPGSGPLGGAGGGKVNIQDLSVTKLFDSTTPDLMLACAKGSHIDEVKLTVRAAGPVAEDYIRFTMTDVLVTSVSTGGSGGEDRVTEHVSLNFAKVEVEYEEQKADGSTETTRMGWNIEQNREF